MKVLQRLCLRHRSDTLPGQLRAGSVHGFSWLHQLLLWYDNTSVAVVAGVEGAVSEGILWTRHGLGVSRRLRHVRHVTMSALSTVEWEAVLAEFQLHCWGNS